jgi:hypothetical protein
MEGAALEADSSGVGLDDIGQALQKHRFARAAGTKESKNASTCHLDSHARKDHMVVKALLEIFHLQE